ncbi:MAG TPA: NADH-quinone oxidoreductase subunit NuoE [Desulforhopalus sp.]|nr:NADH-quinone oxidoreductase subunit NuoE [Desulforhopalus sp.]
MDQTVGRDPTAAQPFSADELAAVDRIVNHHKDQPGALIPVLEEVQEAIGYLPKSIQKRISERMRVPLREIHGVVSFYSFFTMVPRGRHTTRCCLGTACYVRGGKNNLDRLKNALQIEPGETTADQRFSLETVRCLGACGLAPVITVDEDTYKQVKPSTISEILARYE